MKKGQSLCLFDSYFQNQGCPKEVNIVPPGIDTLVFTSSPRILEKFNNVIKGYTQSRQSLKKVIKCAKSHQKSYLKKVSPLSHVLCISMAIPVKNDSKMCIKLMEIVNYDKSFSETLHIETKIKNIPFL